MPSTTDLHVVARNTDLLWNIDGRFFQGMFVPNHIEERHQDMKAGIQRRVIFAEPLDHEGALLRDDASGFGNYDNDEKSQDQRNE